MKYFAFLLETYKKILPFLCWFALLLWAPVLPEVANYCETTYKWQNFGNFSKIIKTEWFMSSKSTVDTINSMF